MANSERLVKNRSGQMLIPMNVDGGAWEDRFFNSTKLVILAGTIFINVLVIAWLTTLYAGWPAYVILGSILLFIDQLILRYFIFEESYYYRMYVKMKKYEISTPSVFWNISSIRDTEDGGIMIYGDGKVGLIVRLERDTITGKSDDFKERHYDAISDFYKELVIKNLKFVQMNVMEQAGKDPRLQKLDDLVIKADNPNIAKIVEAQVGYIKKITRATLFESDYFLIYSDDINRLDSITSDAIDCIYNLLDGAFIGYSILNTNEILEMLKETYGVKYFDYTEAAVSMHRSTSINIPKSFNLVQVNFISGESAEIGNVEKNRLNVLTSYIERGIIKTGEWATKDALQGRIRKVNNISVTRKRGVRLEDIESDAESPNISEINLDDDIFGEVPQREETSLSDKLTNIVDDILYPDENTGKKLLDTDLASDLGLTLGDSEEADSEAPQESIRKKIFDGKRLIKRGIHSNKHRSKDGVDTKDKKQQSKKKNRSEISYESEQNKEENTGNSDNSEYLSDNDFIDF